jgi:glucose-6-phosphate isomerase
MRLIGLDYTHAVAGRNEPGLLTEDELTGIGPKIEAAAKQIESRRNEPRLSWMSLPYAYDPRFGSTQFGTELHDTWTLIGRAAKAIRQRASDYLHLGIGGSALGSIALRDALADGLDPAPGAPESPCRVHLPDNVDPELIDRLIRTVDWSKAYVNVVSKSGGTVEPLTTFFAVYEQLKRHAPPEELKQRVFVTTRPDGGPLHDLCVRQGFTLLPLPESVHGRFSVLSPAGLMTAAVCGIDTAALLDGARQMDQLTRKTPFDQNPVKLLAALHYLFNTQRGLSVLVLLPYSHGLRTMADWYSQLVGESLGKDGQGMTPVKALGATDQHSQLQLYNDGPKDKFVIFFAVERFRAAVNIPPSLPSEDYAYLSGRSLNELLEAERQGTAVSLRNHGVPSCTLQLSELSARTLGALFMLLEKVVCLLGELYEVNAFNQPAVEESKELARAMMGHAGPTYDALRARMQALSSDSQQRTT